MNIEIAERLIKLRKEKGYTQESLADALNISRQAVSKWERAEASPDTDNLICLARLYNVSLDELLSTDDSFEEIRNNSKNSDEEDEEIVSISNGNIYVKDKDDIVNIGPNGIHVKDKDGSVKINLNGIHIKDKDGEFHIGGFYKAKSLAFTITLFLVTVAYLLIGFIKNIWHPTWIMFFLPLIISSIAKAIETKRITHFNDSALITAIYLYLGFVYNLWHPAWVIFLFIPIFHCTLDLLFKKKNITIE